MPVTTGRTALAASEHTSLGGDHPTLTRPALLQTELGEVLGPVGGLTSAAGAARSGARRPRGRLDPGQAPPAVLLSLLRTSRDPAEPPKLVPNPNPCRAKGLWGVELGDRDKLGQCPLRVPVPLPVSGTPDIRRTLLRQPAGRGPAATTPERRRSPRLPTGSSGGSTRGEPAAGTPSTDAPLPVEHIRAALADPLVPSRPSGVPRRHGQLVAEAEEGPILRRLWVTPVRGPSCWEEPEGTRNSQGSGSSRRGGRETAGATERWPGQVWAGSLEEATGQVNCCGQAGCSRRVASA